MSRAILGLPALSKFMAATHPGYNIIKMPGSSGTITIKGDTKAALQDPEHTYRATAAAQPSAEGAPEAAEAAPAKKKQLFSLDRAETKQVPVDEGDASSTFTIGVSLLPEQEEALVAFLKANKDVFAWKATDLVGVPRHVIEHHLTVCPNARPIKQKARRQALEK